MLALVATTDDGKGITAGVKNDKIVTVALKPLAARQKHAVVLYDSCGTP